MYVILLYYCQFVSLVHLVIVNAVTFKKYYVAFPPRSNDIEKYE